MTSLAISVVLQAAVLGAPTQDYAAAYQRSLKSGRPLVVLLGADWCPGCRVMKGQVMPQVAKSGGLRGVEFTYVDVDRQPELAEKLLRSNSIPQLISFSRTTDGWESGELTGAQSSQRVEQFIRAGVSKTAARRKPAARLSSYDQSLPAGKGD